MIVTNLLTQINFSGLTGTLPTAWDLTPTYPNGALDVTHIQARSLTGAWSAWGAVTSFDNATNIATFTADVGATQVEFRRQTPRYSAYLDPKASTSRVSQHNLQVNADQGLYMASELAADLGLDAQAVALPDPTTTPNVLGLVHQTQNRWGAADYTNKSWNFQFAGGYIDRSHVKVQALLSGGWTQIVLDQVTPGAPFRFIGDYTLYLDFTILPETPKGLIIYRHTPRNVHVSSPADVARITSPVMEPSARHALFAAVEIGELLAQYAPTCDCDTAPPDPDLPAGVELREDGGAELREDGGYELRETAPIVEAHFARLEGIHASGNGLDGRLITGLDPTATYQVILRDDGDGFQAWSFNLSVNPSWVTAFRVVKSDSTEVNFFGLGGVGAAGAWPTQAAAYANRNPNMFLTGSSTYYFYIVDDGTNLDNGGGLSITLLRIT